MIKTCRQCQTTFEITEQDLKFYDKVSPVFHGKKYLIPPPTLCRSCREQGRLCFRNESSLYERKCDLCDKNIIAMFPPHSVYTVYCNECWYSERWNAFDFGKDFDFSRSFFDQFFDILQKVPKAGSMMLGNENAEYNNYLGFCKNVYLSHGSYQVEDSYYCRKSQHCIHCVDTWSVDHCQHCYECINCNKCYALFFSQLCNSCHDSYFLKNCNSCSNCFMCCNLRNQEYCFKNEKLSKEIYKQKTEEALKKSFKDLQEEFRLFSQQQIHRNLNNINCENCFGDSLQNSKNVRYSFDGHSLEDCAFTCESNECKDSVDISYFDKNELGYQCCSGGICYNTRFIFCSPNSKNILYCHSCFGIQNSFGCEGLHNKEQYCILNKQYTKEEYEELVPKIIEYMMKTGEWGEFFPPLLSPFGYNETVAQEYYPLTREQALGISDTSNPVGNRHAYSLQHGQIFNWSDYESPKPDVKKIIPASKLPDDITKIPDDILNWAIECEVTKKPFRIIKQELEFYRLHNLPIPRRHPDQRHKDRLALRNPRKLFQRNCMNCNKEIQTTYAPDRKEIVYCEKCYLDTVY